MIRNILLCALMSSAALVSAGGQKSAVATVNGVAIPKTYLEREMRRFEQQALSQGQMVDEAQKEQLKQEALDTLIEIELLYQESQRRGFQISDERVEEQVSELRGQFSGEEGYTQALEQIGIDDKELRIEFRRQLAIQEMIDTDIAPATAVTEAESVAFYEDNPGYFRQPEQVRASHILLLVEADATEEARSEARERIAEIRKRIVAGEDFGELASQFSDDGSGASGGDLGYFQREQMVGPFAEAAFSLEVGELSEVVTTRFGFHIIKVTDRRPQSLVPFENVQLQILEFLKREKVMVAIEELATELKAKAEIEEFALPEG